MSEKIIVASFWTGPPLSNMEIMSIKSFLKNGYEYHLYVYENIENIPDGVVVMDANEIINKSEIFSYQNGSFSSISNQFRFKLMYKTGKIWVDADIVCLKHYDFNNDKYVIMSESNKKYNEEKISSALLKFPKNDPILTDAIETCEKKREEILNGTLQWGLGPATTKYIVEKYDLQKYVKPWYFTNSSSCHHVQSLINPSFTSNEVDKNAKIKYSKRFDELPDGTYFIHMWNEFWRRHNIDKNGDFPKETLYEELKAMFL